MGAQKEKVVVVYMISIASEYLNISVLVVGAWYFGSSGS